MKRNIKLMQIMRFGFLELQLSTAVSQVSLGIGLMLQMQDLVSLARLASWEL